MVRGQHLITNERAKIKNRKDDITFQYQQSFVLKHCKQKSSLYQSMLIAPKVLL